MRQNKWLVYSTFATTIASLVAAICIGKSSNCIQYDISMAIFGSAFLGFIMSLIQYFAERRIGMEKFWSEACKALGQLKTIPYPDIDAPIDMVMRCFHEEERNLSEKNMPKELKLRPKHNAKKELIAWLEENHKFGISNEDDKQSINKHYKKLLREYYNSITKCVEICKTILQYDLGALDNAYSNLDFLFEKPSFCKLGKQSFRESIYNQIYCAIKLYYEFLQSNNYKFQQLGKKHGSFSLCADVIVELRKLVFEVKILDNNSAPYKTGVYQRNFYNIDVELEKFRTKIYHESSRKSDYDPPESSLIFATSERRDFDITAKPDSIETQ